MRSSAFARALALPLALALAFPSTLPLRAEEGAPGADAGPQTSELEITLLDESGEELEGATVAAENVESQHEPFLATTDSGGVARFESLPYGHFVFYFRTADGRTFVGNRALLVGPKRDEDGTFQLDDFATPDEKLGLVPGMEVPAFSARADGVARLEERLGPTGWAWLRTGRGVALIVGGGALVVAALIATAEDDDDEDDVSPSDF